MVGCCEWNTARYRLRPHSIFTSSTMSAWSSPTCGIAGAEPSTFETMALRINAVAGTDNPVRGATAMGTGGGAGSVVVGATASAGGAVVLELVEELDVDAAVPLVDVDAVEDRSVVSDALEGASAAAAADRVGRRCPTSEPSVTVTTTPASSAAASPTLHHAAVPLVPSVVTTGVSRLPRSAAHQRSTDGEGSSSNQTSPVVSTTSSERGSPSKGASSVTDPMSAQAHDVGDAASGLTRSAPSVSRKLAPIHRSRPGVRTRPALCCHLPASPLMTRTAGATHPRRQPGDCCRAQRRRPPKPDLSGQV